MGIRNYRYFLVFVNSVFFCTVYTLALCITELVLRTHVHGDGSAEAFGDALYSNPTPLIVGVFLFLILFAIGGLSGFHGYLIWRNVSTNEELKGMYRGDLHPFRQGRILYALNSFFPQAYPSYIRPKRIITIYPDDV